MKKIMMIALVMAGSAVIFSSCKKDYTCECKDEDGEKTAYAYPKVKKKSAEESCKSANTAWALDGGSCKLK